MKELQIDGMRKKITYSVKDDIQRDACSALSMFLSTWLQENCSSSYTINYYYDPILHRTLYDVCLNSIEDATFLKLKGIPIALEGIVKQI